jgi:AraC-like DNA-binding protein
MMSPMRHDDRPEPGIDDEPAVRAYAVTHPAGRVALAPADGWDQLVYAARGVMTVRADVGTWVVPPHRAVWVPSGVRHVVDATGPLALRTLFFRAGLVGLPARPAVVNVPPLVRELVLHASREAPLRLERPEHAAVVTLLGHRLALLPEAPLQLPWPTDDAARRLAEALMDDPAGDAPVAALARACGGGRRTLERRFATETGLTIGRWRTRARLLAALRLLAEGHTTTRVGGAVGFATPSAFAAAFRRELGTSPQRFAARSGDRE